MKTQFTNYGILYVDDEEKSLKYFQAIFDEIAPIYTASSPEEGYQIFCENHERIGLVLSDKKMPNESGLDFLKRIRGVNPEPLRFLVTAFADLDVAVDALNDGLLFSYLSKPWDPDELEGRLVEAMQHFCLAREREQLIREKAEAFEHLVMADKAASIGILSAGLNHHLRNALTVMQTFYDMLPYQLREEIGGEPRDSSFWNDYYGEVGSQIDRMTSMLTNLSEGARTSLLQLEKGLSLPEHFRQAEELILGEDSEIATVYEVDGDLPLISGDPQKIAQMARLLFQEAKTTFAGSEGEVEVRMKVQPDGTTVQVSFIDNGTPIPEEDLLHLFDPFFVRSERPEDIGTNLMACYLTAYHHGGSIRARRTRDGRNAVEVMLPIFPPSEERAQRSRQILNQFSEFDSRSPREGAVLPS
ncbi:MAG: response regulator [Verrucomicrobiota bacterium]